MILKELILNSLSRIRRVMPKDMKLIKDMITDPTLFEYTTPEGLIYAIDKTGGLQSIKVLNGNTITINANGINYSGGKSNLLGGLNNLPRAGEVALGNSCGEVFGC